MCLVCREVSGPIRRVILGTTMEDVTARRHSTASLIGAQICTYRFEAQE